MPGQSVRVIVPSRFGWLKNTYAVIHYKNIIWGGYYGKARRWPFEKCPALPEISPSKSPGKTQHGHGAFADSKLHMSGLERVMFVLRNKMEK